MSSFLQSSEYRSLPQSAKEDALREWNETNGNLPRRRTFIHRNWAYLTHGLLLLFCATFFTLWVQARAPKPILPYSPANVAVENRQEYTVFNGSFNFPSIYRGQPTPELDEAWNKVSMNVRLGRLTREQLLQIGKEDTPSKVRYREEDGGGYMAALEVTHQLHCLNQLRKYVHFEYYGTVDPFFTESRPDTYKRHLEHCIDNLRQVLMCTADASMITFEWVRGFSTAYPDFNTRHQCRNFEKLIDWQNSNGIHGIPNSHIVRLESEVDLIHPP